MVFGLILQQKPAEENSTVLHLRRKHSIGIHKDPCPAHQSRDAFRTSQAELGVRQHHQAIDVLKGEALVKELVARIGQAQGALRRGPGAQTEQMLAFHPVEEGQLFGLADLVQHPPGLPEPVFQVLLVSLRGYDHVQGRLEAIFGPIAQVDDGGSVQGIILPFVGMALIGKMGEDAADFDVQVHQLLTAVSQRVGPFDGRHQPSFGLIELPHFPVPLGGQDLRLPLPVAGRAEQGRGLGNQLVEKEGLGLVQACGVAVADQSGDMGLLGVPARFLGQREARQGQPEQEQRQEARLPVSSCFHFELSLS